MNRDNQPPHMSPTLLSREGRGLPGPCPEKGFPSSQMLDLASCRELAGRHNPCTWGKAPFHLQRREADPRLILCHKMSSHVQGFISPAGNTPAG